MPGQDERINLNLNRPSVPINGIWRYPGMRLLPWESKTKLKKAMEIEPPPPPVGYRFSLKGSPRHYDDVREIIEAGGGAKVYFGEALAYERGAGVALWRVRAVNFDWLPKLYAWWVEMERIEPVQFTFHLYMPDNPRYPAMDLREHSAQDVMDYIITQAPWDGKRPSASRSPSAAHRGAGMPGR